MKQRVSHLVKIKAKWIIDCLTRYQCDHNFTSLRDQVITKLNAAPTRPNKQNNCISILLQKGLIDVQTDSLLQNQLKKENWEIIKFITMN